MRSPSRALLICFVWSSLALMAWGYWTKDAADLAKRPTFADALKGVLADYKGESRFDLTELIGVKSISGSGKNNRDLQDAAEWLVGRLGHMTIENARILETDGVHPVVYAEWLRAGAHKPTILIYAFFDVPPLSPLLSWDEPFKLGGARNTFWGRGVAGGKGALLMALQAVERILRAQEVASDKRLAELPFNVKFLFESQAEMGSPDLAPLLKKHRDLLSADVCLAAAGAHEDDKGHAAAKVPDTFVNRAAAKAWKDTFGGAISFNRDPSAVPALAAIQSELGLTPTVFGWGLGADINTPKESIKPEQYDKGCEAWINLLLQLSTEEAATEVRASDGATAGGAKGAAGGEAEQEGEDEGLCSWGGADGGNAQAASPSCSAPHEEL